MSLSQYMDGAARTGKRPAPLAISLVLHGAAFFVLMHAPEIKLPEPSKSEYRQVIEGHETKLVWYEFRKDLPDVSPLQAKRELKPLRAERRAPQQIVASRKDAPKRPQIIQTDAPELKETKAFKLPNVLAVRLPQIARPFVAPPEAPPLKAKVTMPDAPQLTQAFEPVRLADASKMTRRFVPPPEKVPVKIAEVAPPPEAPAVEAVDASPALSYSFKAPPRPFTAPSRATPAAAKTVHVDAPPALAGTGAFTSPNDLLAANSRDLSLVAVSLNPAAKAASVPSSSSPGQFSAGPKPRPEGADSAGDGKGITVPDLYITGNKSAKPDLIAQVYAAPTSQQSLRAAARLAEPRAPASGEDLREPAHPGAVKVSNGPDKRFDGRDVYMMAIQMPNLTSYSGSWLMWYADRTARETGLAPVAPPVAHRKVDPKYIAAAAADKIEGKVQLACVIGKDGRVSTVEILRGLDERLNQSAEEALAKWEFTPATRRGEPVEVDVVVEIPFRLAPRTQVPY